MRKTKKKKKKVRKTDFFDFLIFMEFHIASRRVLSDFGGNCFSSDFRLTRLSSFETGVHEYRKPHPEKSIPSKISIVYETRMACCFGDVSSNKVPVFKGFLMPQGPF